MSGILNLNFALKPVASGGSLLLDTYTGASGAYSLRLLRTAYSGALVRVRRSSDNTENDFYQGASAGDLNTTSGGGGTSLASFCSGTDGFVVTWYDQSGNANNLTQSTTTQQFKIVSSGTVITDGGKPAMTLDGSNDYMSLGSAISGTSSWHVTMVHKRRASSVVGPQFASNASSQYSAWLYSDNTWYARGREGYISSTSSGTLAAQCLATTEWINGGSKTVYLNGTSLFSGTPAIPATDDFQYIGRRHTDYGDGNIQEIVIWKLDQSSNRSGIDTEIKTYYSL